MARATPGGVGDDAMGQPSDGDRIAELDVQLWDLRRHVRDVSKQLGYGDGDSAHEMHDVDNTIFEMEE